MDKERHTASASEPTDSTDGTASTGAGLFEDIRSVAPLDTFEDSTEPDTADDAGTHGLFDDLLSGEPIFENKEVLRPSYTPHELPHRTDQINGMATILVSPSVGRPPRTS
jgi:ORC complex protein Cdc6/Orc1